MGYFGDDIFDKSDDPSNSVKALKDGDYLFIYYLFIYLFIIGLPQNNKKTEEVFKFV